MDTGSITVDNTTGAVTTPAEEDKVATTKTVSEAIQKQVGMQNLVAIKLMVIKKQQS